MNIEAMRERRNWIEERVAELTVERREIDRALRIANVRAIEKKQREERKARVWNPTPPNELAERDS